MISRLQKAEGFFFAEQEDPAVYCTVCDVILLPVVGEWILVHV